MAISSILVMVLGCLVISSPEDFTAVDAKPIPSQEIKSLDGASAQAVASPQPASPAPAAPEEKKSYTIMEGLKDSRFHLLLILLVITNCKCVAIRE